MVVEPEQPGDPLGVRVAVREVRDEERAARPKDSADLVQASVRILHVLEDAAGEDRVEALVLERQLDGVGAEVGLDLGEALQRLDGRCRDSLPIIERDGVDPFPAEQRGHLPVAAPPVEEASGIAPGQPTRH